MALGGAGLWRWAGPGCDEGGVVQHALACAREFVCASASGCGAVSIPQDKQIISERMLKLKDSDQGQIKNQTLCRDVKLMIQ